MEPLTTSAFDLPENLSAKADPSLIAADDRHFAAIAENLRQSIAELTDRLAAERRARGGHGQEAMERDQQIHRLTVRLRTLRRYGLDLCLGHMVTAQDPEEPVYIGRLGLTDNNGRQLMIDWRSLAAEPFFGATHANPMGLAHRRRYRWSRGKITDYWDEVFTAEGLESQAALDDQSAFIASLGANRSSQMRDVLGTIQADQDAIIRAGSRGALIVDGGPGTGKTVVALHRTAYLLYSDPRLSHDRGGVLFVGPHQPYLNYVADVLPSLGEEGVRTSTLRGLVVEGTAAGPEPDPAVAALKASTDMVRAIEAAVRFHEDPPAATTVVTDWAEIRVSAGDWAEAVDTVVARTPHNEARQEILDELATIVVDRLDLDDAAAPIDEIRDAVRHNKELHAMLTAVWPLLESTEVVGDLWTVPAYLRLCAPWLEPDQLRQLQRADPRAWTVADLPLLDAARRRLGDPDTDQRNQRATAALAAAKQEMDSVIDDLIAHDDSEMRVMSMLRGEDLTDALVDEDALPHADPDRYAGPFAHIVVDEAQELTDAEWQMLVQRCPSRSFTIVGDRAQARHGFSESWRQRLERIGLQRATLASLSINYRTPKEVMAEAEPVIRAALPDANVPTSIRGTGIGVRHGSVTELDAILQTWLADNDEGVACVISCQGTVGPARPDSRVRSLTPELAKGLEFDLVVLIDPDGFGTGIEGAVDRYVAMTRATRQLVVLTS